MSGPILVIGSANADRIMRLPRLPAKGETVTQGIYMETHGGKGANQAVAAARAGGRVVFVACLGEDAAGDAMMENFQRDGIGTDHMLRCSETHTGAALVLFDAQGDNILAVAPGTNHRLFPAHIDAISGLIGQSAMVVLQMEIPTETLVTVIGHARRHRIPVLMNYAPAQNPDLPIDTAMTTLVVNELEAAALTGLPVSDPAEALAAAKTLRGRGPSTVMVTLGRLGVCVLAEGESFHQAAFDVEAVDATAAGDTFCGALAVALCEGRPLRECVTFASAAAALCVTRAGAQSSIPRREAITAFLENARRVEG